MSSNSPGSSQNSSTGSSQNSSTSSSKNSSSGSKDLNSLPRGLLCRKGVPVARGARLALLPSLRSPRDLTLGGTTKRTFTPNIPARREKKDETVKTGSAGSSSERGRGARKNQTWERGRGRGRGNVIQLQGSVFGEGISMEGARKRGTFGQSSREESSSKSVPVPKYTPNNKSQTQEEKEEEQEKLDALLRDDFLEEWEEEDDLLRPVQLPLLVKEVKVENDKKPDVKPKFKQVKKEDLTDEEDSSMDVDRDVKPDVKKEVKEDPDEVNGGVQPMATAAKLFTNQNIPEKGQLLFFQFPDCLPGASAKSDEDTRIKVEPGTSSAAAPKPTAETNGHCVLSDLPEGLIGKLQVLKSGRTRLLLGSVCLNVELGTPIGFLQDLVSVRIKDDREPATGDMFVLGHVQDKLVCLPDMESLLKNIKKL